MEDLNSEIDKLIASDKGEKLYSPNAKINTINSISNEEIQAILTKAFNTIMEHSTIKALGSAYRVQLAAGLSNGCIANAKNGNPSFPTITKLCYICEVPVHTLLREL